MTDYFYVTSEAREGCEHPGSEDLKEMKAMEQDMEEMRDLGDLKEPGPEVQT